MRRRGGRRGSERAILRLVAAGAVLSLFVAASGSASSIRFRGHVSRLAGVGSLESLFASEGVATVGSMASTVPVDPVTGRVTLRFTTAQVRAMAAGAASGAGLQGAALDAALPAPRGVVPFSYLLAAWVSRAGSPGADAVRSLMGRDDWSRAPRLVFPVVALPLFTVDVIRALHGSSAVPTSRPAPSRAMVGSIIQSPCSLVSGYIDDVMSTVFADLTLTSPPGASLGTKIGRFFVDTWNTGLSYAQTAVSGLLKTVSETALKTIENLAAGAAVAAEVITNIAPWTAKVTARPPSIALGDGGSFKVEVSSGAGDREYPDAVKVCAEKLGFTLPALNAKQAHAKWKLSAPLSPSGPTSVDLDNAAESTVDYTTKSESSSGGSGGCSGGGGSKAPGPESAEGSITVTRPAIDDLKGVLSNLLSTNVPVVGSTVEKLLKPLLDEVLGRLDALTEIAGSAKVTIEPPSSSGGGGGTECTTSTKTTTTTAGGGPCMVGTWTARNVTISGHGGSFGGGAGARWIIKADGSEAIEWDGSGYFVLGGQDYYRYTGVETEHVTIGAGSSGKWLGKAVSDNRTAVYSAEIAKATGKTSEPVTTPAGVTSTGTYTCNGNSMTIDVTAEGVGIAVQLARG
jgi:hypothetical protein